MPDTMRREQATHPQLRAPAHGDSSGSATPPPAAPLWRLRALLLPRRRRLLRLRLPRTRATACTPLTPRSRRPGPPLSPVRSERDTERRRRRQGTVASAPPYSKMGIGRRREGRRAAVEAGREAGGRAGLAAPPRGGRGTRRESEPAPSGILPPGRIPPSRRRDLRGQ